MSFLKNIFGGGGGGGGGANLDAQQKALNDQLALMREQFDYQKEQDTKALGIAQSNADFQKQAYETQLQQAKDAFEEEKKATAAQLGMAQASFSLQASSTAATQAREAKSLEMQIEELNRVNQKQPDVASIFARNQQQMRTGQSSTLLTGPQGVKDEDLALGRPTLLGA